MANPVLLTPEVASAGVSALGSIGNTFFGNLLGRSNMQSQIAASKDLMKYEWDNFKSPKAQVSALAAAGLNPAVALGQGGSGFSATPSPSLPTLPTPQTNVIGDISSFVQALAEAKKAGVDMKNIEVDTQAKQFDLDLSKIYKSPQQYASLTLAWKNVMLATDEHNIKVWSEAKEKALSQLSGVQRDTAQKVLDNMDIQIKQENKQRDEDIKLTQEKQKTEKTSQTANRAAANASNTQASVNRENRRLQAALADIEEAGKTDKIKSLISEYKSKGLLSEADAKDAKIRLDRLSSVEDKRSSVFFREVDNYLEWLKNKVSIFKTK